ncbi:hypothetical protein ACLOJK_036096 [Asimina triloba]
MAIRWGEVGREADDGRPNALAALCKEGLVSNFHTVQKCPWNSVSGFNQIRLRKAEIFTLSPAHLERALVDERSGFLIHDWQLLDECKMPPSSSFCRLVYSEIEEVGWEHLVKSSEDLSSLTFRVLDKKGRAHTLEIALPQDYPKCAPSIAAAFKADSSIVLVDELSQPNAFGDVPYVCGLQWSVHAQLKDVVRQFSEHLDELQGFWSTLDDIDRDLWVVEPRQASNAASFRQIYLGKLFGCACNDFVMIDKSLSENLANMLETALPGPPTVSKDDQQTDCGICYAHCLPIDDELGVLSGSAPDYACDNPSCSRAFHSVCLGDWLRTITATRQSFGVLFGNCPYCSEPVAVKINAGDMGP